MTSMEENVFYEAVCDYVHRLGKECAELARVDGRKSIAKDHIDVVLRYIIR